MKLYFQRQSGYDSKKGEKYPIYLNNFGYFKDIDEDIYTARADGRADFHLIYVSHGEVELDNDTPASAILKDGDYCIFTPGEAQKYTYRATRDSLYYWAHFTGYDVPEILNRPALRSGAHISNGRRDEADSILSLMTQSAREEREHSELLASLFHSLLLLLSAPAKEAQPFSRAKRKLEDLSSGESIEEIASLYRMTPEHFIRSFRAAYGTTPQNYRIESRLSKAKNLLDSTTLSVLSISEICGYRDPYYFSRLFKKHVGKSPSEYRKSGVE